MRGAILAKEMTVRALDVISRIYSPEPFKFKLAHPLANIVHINNHPQSLISDFDEGKRDCLISALSRINPGSGDLTEMTSGVEPGIGILGLAG
jgi:hypothetical protein